MYPALREVFDSVCAWYAVVLQAFCKLSWMNTAHIHVLGMLVGTTGVGILVLEYTGKIPFFMTLLMLAGFTSACIASLVAVVGTIIRGRTSDHNIAMSCKHAVIGNARGSSFFMIAAICFACACILAVSAISFVGGESFSMMDANNAMAFSAGAAICFIVILLSEAGVVIAHQEMGKTVVE